MRASWRLGTWRGTPIEISWSWIWIVAAVLLLYTPMLRRTAPELGPWAYLVSLAFCVLLGMSVLLHEMAHAVSARAFGWPVHRIQLNLLGGHTRFGTACPTARASAVVSVAGPAANLVVAALGLVTIILVSPAPGAELTGAGISLWTLVDLVTWSNFFVGLFNLLPGLPLDGGRAVEALVWAVTGSEATGTAVAAWCGRVMTLALAAAVLLTGLRREPLAIALAVGAGWMLLSGASGALRQARAARSMGTVSAGELAQEAVAVDGRMSRTAARYVVSQVPGSVWAVAVDSAGMPRGVLLRQAMEGPGDGSLEESAQHIVPAAVLAADLRGLDLLEAAARSGDSFFAVVDRRPSSGGSWRDSTVVGVITAEQINELLSRERGR